jgi:hypothetical protein
VGVQRARHVISPEEGVVSSLELLRFLPEREVPLVLLLRGCCLLARK